MSELAGKFHALFMGLERAHGLWVNGEKAANNKVKGKARTVKQPVTDELWAGHLTGKLGIGIIAIDDRDESRWGAIDIDVYDGLDHEYLETQLENIGAPMVVVRSKSGGAHLYLFTKAPVKATLMRQRLLEIAMALGHPTAEVFPKQTYLIDPSTQQENIGNWINMPYQDAVKTCRYAIHHGRALGPEEFLELAESRSLSPLELQEFKPRRSEEDEWTQAPPCLQRLVAEGFPEGSRNNALLCLGIYAKKAYPEDWENRVVEYNKRWMNGTFSEVANIVRSLSRSDYKYKCKDVPLINVCNREECYGRTFGISDGEPPRGPGRPSKKDNLPCVLEEVDRPVKVYRPPEGSGDEPQWVFRIMGKTLDVSLDMLYDQKKFLREFARVFERLYPEVGLLKWQKKVNELLAEAEPLELPPDAGPEGQLMLHLEAFCTGKVRAADKTELILGRPWTDEDNTTWFRSKDFMSYLDRQRFKGFKEKELWAIFRRNGAQNTRYMIKGTCVAAWGFPAFTPQQEELDPVTVPFVDENGEERF